MRKSFSKFLTPFMERYPQYKLLPVGGIIHSTPIGHLFHVFSIQDTSRKGTYYLFDYLATLINAPIGKANFSCVVQSNAFVFSTLDEHYEAKVMEAMEQRAAVMGKIVDFPALFDFAVEREKPSLSRLWRAFQPLGVIHVAMGDFESAKKKLALAYPFFLRLMPKNQNSPGTREYYERLRALERALDGDPKAVFAMIREWEAINVLENGFEPYWTPKPFPGEIAMGLAKAI